MELISDGHTNVDAHLYEPPRGYGHVHSISLLNFHSKRGTKALRNPREVITLVSRSLCGTSFVPVIFLSPGQFHSGRAIFRPGLGRFSSEIAARITNARNAAGKLEHPRLINLYKRSYTNAFRVRAAELNRRVFSVIQFLPDARNISSQ